MKKLLNNHGSYVNGQSSSWNLSGLIILGDNTEGRSIHEIYVFKWETAECIVCQITLTSTGIHETE